MKRLFTLSIIFVLGSVSCDDIDRFPRDVQNTGTFFSAESDALQFLAGMYNTFQGWVENLAYFDCMTNNANYRDGGWSQVALLDHSPLQGPQGAIWNTAYTGVQDANYLVNNVGRIPASQAVIDRYVAEGKFLRAYWYHVLVSYFGDVPYYTDLLNATEYNDMPRTERATVVSHIVKDLDDAIAGLPVKDNKGIYRATKGAALALKMRVQLYEKNWQGVIDTHAQFAAIAAEAGYGYGTDYRNMFLAAGENSPEAVFQINFTPEAQGETASIQRAWREYVRVQPLPNYMLAHEVVDPSALDPTPVSFSYAEPIPDYRLGRDPRLTHNVIAPEIDEPWDTRNISVSRYVIRKMTKDMGPAGNSQGNQTDNNIMLLRYSDVEMMYAEALNEMNGPSDEVYDIIDAIRTRPTVELDPINRAAYATKDALRDVIFHERRIEFAFEGLWYHDMKRRDDAFIIDQMNAVMIPGDTRATAFANQGTAKFRLMPVPQTEIDINPNLLPQNEGY